MSHEKIRSIFDTLVNEWAMQHNISIAFQNVQFIPPTDKPYLKLFILPASTNSSDLEGKMRTFMGVYQINVVGSAGRGLGDINELIERLINLFPLYEKFTQDGFSVQVVTPVFEAKPIQTETTCTLPLSFEYRSDIFI